MDNLHMGRWRFLTYFCSLFELWGSTLTKAWEQTKALIPSLSSKQREQRNILGSQSHKEHCYTDTRLKGSRLDIVRTSFSSRHQSRSLRRCQKEQRVNVCLSGFVWMRWFGCCYTPGETLRMCHSMMKRLGLLQSGNRESLPHWTAPL